MNRQQFILFIALLSVSSIILIVFLAQNKKNEVHSHISDKVQNGKKTIKIKVSFVWEPIPTNENPHCLIYDLLKDTYNIVYSENPDFWFYTSKVEKKKLDYKNCVKIFLSGENIMPDFNKCDYAATFSHINFGDRHFRYDFGFSEHLYKAIRGQKKENVTLGRNMAKRKFCNFIYRDHMQKMEGVRAREKFFQLLSEYKHIDSPGKVFNNMKNPIKSKNGNWHSGKLDFIKDYKFTIAFENSNSDGYTSEKLPDAFFAHTVPIYFGNPNIGLEYNKKAFIHANDYDSLEDVVKKVIELDNDDDAYMAMLNEPPLLNPDYDMQEELKKFFIKIIEKGNKPYHKNPLGVEDEGEPLFDWVICCFLCLSAVITVTMFVILFRKYKRIIS